MMISMAMPAWVFFPIAGAVAVWLIYSGIKFIKAMK